MTCKMFLLQLRNGGTLPLYCEVGRVGPSARYLGAGTVTRGSELVSSTFKEQLLAPTSPHYPACCVSNADRTFRCVQLVLAGWAICLPRKREMEESNLPELVDDLATLRLGSQSRETMLYPRNLPSQAPATCSSRDDSSCPRARNRYACRHSVIRAGQVLGLRGLGHTEAWARSDSGGPRGWPPPPLQAATEGPSGLRRGERAAAGVRAAEQPPRCGKGEVGRLESAAARGTYPPLFALEQRGTPDQPTGGSAPCPAYPIVSGRGRGPRPS